MLENTTQMDDFAGPNPFDDSFSQCDLNRSSLGIFDINGFGANRESLDLLADDFGRESLGIINLSGLDVGRESLGITNIKTYDFVLSNVNLPQIPEEPNLIAAEELQQKFNDSVLIEANHLAERISDGSFIGTDNDTLDSTQEPEYNVDIVSEEPAPKCDTEVVFKSVDKLFGCSDQDQNTPNEENVSNKLIESVKQSDETDISKDSNENTASPRSTDPMKLLHRLSTILSNIPNESQKSEGMGLLASLTDIFVSNSVSIKSPHLPMKRKLLSDPVYVSPKMLPPRAKIQRTSVASIATNSTAGSSCGSIGSVSSNDSNNSLKKFRLKKTEEALKRGPMRAVIPISNMARDSGGNAKITPTRSQSSTVSKLKKTSTPINESNMKPMAQSTPDGARASYTLSPIARPNLPSYSSPRPLKGRSGIPERQSTTKSHIPSRSNSIFKRNFSVGDLKIPEHVQKPIKRYSMRESSTIAKSKIATRENGNRSMERPSGIKRSGKENLA